MDESQEKFWQEIPGYEGLYAASIEGEICGIRRGHLWKPLRFHEVNGYRRVILSQNNKVKAHLIHCLVWLAHEGPVPDGLEINHINHRRTDNSLENLELVTRRENLSKARDFRRSRKRET